ncbi:MAG TPA: prepilin-type N-terminal cleavage/methylation domain-containing protein [Pyrinomonadaceae bacterium]
MARSRTSRSERGFTMIETVIALVVMMVAGLSVASLFVYATRNNSGAADRAVALAVAQQRMERLRSVSFNDATLAAGTTNTTVVNGDGRNYSVQTVICDTAACGGSSTLKKITIQVTPMSAGQLWAANAVVLTSLRASPETGDFIQ